MTSQRLTFLLIFALLSALLTGCGPSNAPGIAPEEATKLQNQRAQQIQKMPAPDRRMAPAGSAGMDAVRRRMPPR